MAMRAKGILGDNVNLSLLKNCMVERASYSFNSLLLKIIFFFRGESSNGIKYLVCNGARTRNQTFESEKLDSSPASLLDTLCNWELSLKILFLWLWFK